LKSEYIWKGSGVYNYVLTEVKQEELEQRILKLKKFIPTLPNIFKLLKKGEKLHIKTLLRAIERLRLEGKLIAKEVERWDEKGWYEVKK